MTLTVHTEEDTQRQMLISVAVPEDRIQRAMQIKARELSRTIQIPGFRKGKVPYNVLIKRIGRENLRAEVVEDMLPDLVEEALTQADVEPYAPLDMDDLEVEPLNFKLIVPLSPEITLGDYRSIRKELAPVEVDDEAVEEALTAIQEKHETLETVERPAELGDVVVVKAQGYLVGGDDDEEELIYDHEDAQLLLDPQRSFVDTPLVENIVGMSVGEEKEITFAFAEDYEDEELAGREALFEVALLEVKRRDLPPIDDELAQKEGEYASLEEWKEEIRQQLQTEAEQTADNDLLDEMLEEMIAGAQIAYPPAMITQEIDRRLESIKKRFDNSGINWEDIVNAEEGGEAALRDSLREGAQQAVERSLILVEFARQEKLSVQPEDIDRTLDEQLSKYDNPEVRDYIRQLYTSGENLEQMTNEILSKKIQERIKLIVSGDAPDLAELEAAEEAGSADEEE